MGGRFSFSGLGTGIDFQSIVNSVIAFESRRIDLIRARQAEQTTRLTAIQSFNALLVGLRNQASALGDPGDFDVRSATSSNSTAVEATLTGNAAVGTQSIVVNALAQSAQVASQGIASLDTTLGTGTIEITVGGVATTITLDTTNNTLSGLRDAINGSDASVTATVINDGSATNPFRLLLTGTTTGAANTIAVTTSLTGGLQTPNFATSVIDAAEADTNNDAAYTGIAQSSGTYTGSLNTKFVVDMLTDGAVGVATFRYSADGGQTFNDNGGAGFTTATTPVALQDGVAVAFTNSGTLTTGDRFTVDIFSPHVQQAQDASITLGDPSGGGAPITISSASNTIADLIPGVTLDLLQASASTVSITVSTDDAAVTSAITSFVSSYNRVLDFLDNQLDFDEDTQQAGVLLGDSVLVNVQNRLRRLVTNTVPGLPSNLNRLSAIGITTNIESGRLVVDDTILGNAVRDNPAAVEAIFSTSFTSSSPNVTILNSTIDTVPGSYDVDITQVATQGAFTGTGLGAFPTTLTGTNNEVRLIVNGQESGVITLDARTYNTASELALELETKINADSTLGARDVAVTVEGGAFVITSRGFGSNSTVSLGPAPTNNAATVLGLSGGSSVKGLNIQGTLNGEAATGFGQVLTGNTGNATTAGLAIRSTLTTAQLVAGGAEAQVRVTEGIARQLDNELTRLTDAQSGRLTRRQDALNTIIKDLGESIAVQVERLEARRLSLLTQFARLEASLSQITAQGDALTQQLSNLPRIDTLTRRNNS